MGSKKELAFTERFDSVAERVIQGSFDYSGCLQPFMDIPGCENACRPTEYAAKGRKVINTMDGADDVDGLNGIMFGLPKFEELDFLIMGEEQVHWVDPWVPKMLNLRVATHRRKSIERLVWSQEKARLPATLQAKEVKAMTRKLLQCDHVNLMRCKEVAEDCDNIYLLYEYLPYRTLASVITQVCNFPMPKLCNLAREMCTAMGFAIEHFGLHHLSLSAFHVLVPPDIEESEFSHAKVFGVGLVANLHGPFGTKHHWAPETVEDYNRARDRGDYRFLLKLMETNRTSIDSWGMGTLLYAIVEGRYPFGGSDDELDRLIKIGDVLYPPSFEIIDREIKPLVRRMLTLHPLERLYITDPAATRSEWFKKHWRIGLSVVRAAFKKLETFVYSSLAHRLFGRFLVQFLDAKACRTIAVDFYALDLDGDGVLSMADLEHTAKSMEGTKKGTTMKMMSHLSRGKLPVIGFWQFADSMAEAVIDDRAMKLAFECIDKDGSQNITPFELWETLHVFNPEVTPEQVEKYVIATEKKVSGVAGDNSEQDHQLDFQEFTCLFPERCRRIDEIQERIDHSVSRGKDVNIRYQGVKHDIRSWVRFLQDCIKDVTQSRVYVADPYCSMANRKEGLDLIARIAGDLTEAVKGLPGPYDDFPSLVRKGPNAIKGNRITKQEGLQTKEGYFYAFDGFLQEHAVRSEWAFLFLPDQKYFAKVIQKRKDKGPLKEVEYAEVVKGVDDFMFKLRQVYNWSSGQSEEYDSFSLVLSDMEKPIGELSVSGRGLHASTDVQLGGVDGLGQGDGNDQNADANTSAGMKLLACMCRQGNMAMGGGRKLISTVK